MTKATRTSLRRTVLGIAVAALVAAWLPFLVLYTGTASNSSVVVSKSGSAVVTKTSGGQTRVVSGSPSAVAQPVSTRTS
jgi:hypothetical protein